jgi:esterase/lipase
VRPILALVLALAFLTPARSQAMPTSFSYILRTFETYVSRRLQQISSPLHAPRIRHHWRKTKYSVVLIHGLFESPRYMQGLADFFYDQGFNVVEPLLQGHWTKQLNEAQFVYSTFWIDDAENALHYAEQLGDNVIMAGYSTGGLLAVYTAAAHPHEVKGLVTFAPATGLTWKAWAAAHAGTFASWFDLESNLLRGAPSSDGVEIPYFTGEPGVQVIDLIDKLTHSNPEYDRLPLVAFDATDSQRLAALYHSVTVPSYVVYSTGDGTVDSTAVDFLYDNLGGPKDRIIYHDLDHGQISKSEKDQVGWRRGYFNPHFQDMTNSIAGFLKVQFR